MQNQTRNVGSLARHYHATTGRMTASRQLWCHGSVTPVGAAWHCYTSEPHLELSFAWPAPPHRAIASGVTVVSRHGHLHDSLVMPLGLARQLWK